MKKKVFAFLALAALTASLAACGNASGETSESAAKEASKEETAAAEEASSAEETEAEGEGATVKLTIGASITPHAEILNHAKELLAKEGIEIEVMEFTDYVLPNTALEEGDIDANYFQHGPYLEQFNVEQGTHLASAGTIHYEPFGIFAGTKDDLSTIAEGDKIAVPNDTTNEARALLLLEANGIITLKEDAGLTATKNDIAENPKNVEIVELESAQISHSLDSVAFAVMNGNYAIQAGYKPTDALAVEDADSIGATTYGNVIAVREGDENSDWAKKLVEVLHSDEMKSWMEEYFEGAVIPLD